MITYDVAGVVAAHKAALCAVFGVPCERVDVRETVTWEGADPHPVVTIDLRLDGAPAPDAWWRLSADIITIAKLRAEETRLRVELAEARERIAALPWWRRAIMWMRRATR